MESQKTAFSWKMRCCEGSLGVCLCSQCFFTAYGYGKKGQTGVKRSTDFEGGRGFITYMYLLAFLHS